MQWTGESEQAAGQKRGAQWACRMNRVSRTGILGVKKKRWSIHVLAFHSQAMRPQTNGASEESFYKTVLQKTFLFCKMGVSSVVGCLGIWRDSYVHSYLECHISWFRPLNCNSSIHVKDCSWGHYCHYSKSYRLKTTLYLETKYSRQASHWLSQGTAQPHLWAKSSDTSIQSWFILLRPLMDGLQSQNSKETDK